MDSTLIAPALVIVLILIYIIGRYYQTLSAPESDDHEYDGNQSTRIRHEANLWSVSIQADESSAEFTTKLYLWSMRTRKSIILVKCITWCFSTIILKWCWSYVPVVVDLNAYCKGESSWRYKVIRWFAASCHFKGKNSAIASDGGFLRE